eukprot:tig00021013_g17048.t1
MFGYLVKGRRPEGSIRRRSHRAQSLVLGTSAGASFALGFAGGGGCDGDGNVDGRGPRGSPEVDVNAVMAPRFSSLPEGSLLAEGAPPSPMALLRARRAPREGSGAPASAGLASVPLAVPGAEADPTPAWDRDLV